MRTMPSLKRCFSNTDEHHKSNKSLQSVTKVAKKSCSLKSTPLTIQKSKQNFYSEAAENGNHSEKYFPNIDEETDTCEKVIRPSEKKILKDDDDTKDFEIAMPPEKEDGNLLFSETVCANASDISYQEKYEDCCAEIYEESTSHETIQKTPSMRKSDFTQHRVELGKFIGDIENVGQSSMKTSVYQSALAKCTNDLPESMSDPSMTILKGSEVKSILKKSLRKTYSPLGYQRKKVRFNLGPQSEECITPKSLHNLFKPPNITPSNGDFWNSSVSKDNTEIPEKDNPAMTVKKIRNRFRVTSAEINVPGKNSQNNCLPTNSFRNLTKSTKKISDTINNFDNKDRKLVIKENGLEDKMIPELGPKDNTKISIKNKEVQLVPSPAINLQKTKNTTNTRISKIDNENNTGIAVKFNNLHELPTAKKPQRKPTIKPYSNLKDLNRSFNPSKTCNKYARIKTGFNPEYGNDTSTHMRSSSNESISNGHSYNVFVDKLIKSPKKELLNFLETLSLAISLRENKNDDNDTILLKNLLNDMKNKIEQKNNFRSKCQCSRKNKPHSDLNHEEKDCNLECHRVIVPGIKAIDSSSSSSSVTSVSSLLSLSSVEELTHEVNVKSYKFLHQCMEETFCYDNLSGGENSCTKTEYRNYSHSYSSDSKAHDNSMLNNTLEKITTLLEELNSKVDKITTTDESQGINNTETLFDVKQYEVYESESPENKKLSKSNSSEHCEEESENLKERELDQQSKKNVHKGRSNIISNYLDSKEFQAEQNEERNSRDKVDTYTSGSAMQPGVRHNMTINSGSPVLRVRGRTEKAGIIFYSQSESEAFIKFLGKSCTDNKSILPAPPTTEVIPQCTSDSQDNKPNSCNDSNIANIPSAPGPVLIDRNDVQAILKRINEEIKGVKLTSPSMFGLATRRRASCEKTRTPIKEVSQSIQKAIHSILHSIFKLVPHRGKPKLNKSKNKEKTSSAEELNTSNIFRLLFPFCKPNEGSDDKLKNYVFNVKGKGDKEIQTEDAEESDETEASGSIFEGWPDVRRTRYPNGTLHYGPLSLMPEPKHTISDHNFLRTYKQHSGASCDDYNKIIYKKILTKKFSLSDSNLQRRIKSGHSHCSKTQS